MSVPLFRQFDDCGLESGVVHPLAPDIEQVPRGRGFQPSGAHRPVIVGATLQRSVPALENEGALRRRGYVGITLDPVPLDHI